MLISLEHGGVGDELATTPLLRELRRQRPREVLRLEGFRRPELLQGNPHVVGGEEDSGERIQLRHGYCVDAGSLPRKFASQAGIDLQDDTPEIHLSLEEKARPFGIVCWARTVAIDTWARGPARRWPFDRFQRVVDALLAQGWTVLEVGRHSGPPLQGAISFRQVLSLRETAALLWGCTLYLGNDSGLFHLAAAVGTPQVIIFGPVPGRLRAYQTTTCLGTSERCKGCTTDHCVREAACLLRVQPEDVVAAVWATEARIRRS